MGLGFRHTLVFLKILGDCNVKTSLGIGLRTSRQEGPKCHSPQALCGDHHVGARSWLVNFIILISGALPEQSATLHPPNQSRSYIRLYV